MADPVEIIITPANAWQKVATAVTKGRITVKTSGPTAYYYDYVATGNAAPVNISTAERIDLKGFKDISQDSLVDCYVYCSGLAGSIIYKDGLLSISPVESNGAVPINVQDQHSRMIDLKFVQAAGAPTTLAAEAVVGDKTLTLTSTVGFVAGNVVALFTATGEFYFGQQIGAPAGNVITVDTPIDVTYPIGSNILTAIKNMNVKGDVTTQIFQIGPVGAGSGIEIDITRVTGYIQDGTAMDDALFGALAALTNGIVLRKNNGIMRNIWNAKTNGELAEICASDLIYTTKAPAGSFGARFRNSFSGQEKHGVTIRLEPGDILEMLIQDDLTGLEVFSMTAQGHVVTD